MNPLVRRPLGNSPAPPGPPDLLCGNCRHFCREPREIEAQLPGMRSLGSVYGSVRASDGICRRHDRYLAASCSCASHELEPRVPGGDIPVCA
ncbi:MAG: hypothetical protein JWM63_3602 [Gammaproteobacteria bacterium]|nr:hypothetical protein [Gammaproteobacteria bacterium]